jgi:hypothetical protein
MAEAGLSLQDKQASLFRVEFLMSMGRAGGARIRRFFCAPRYGEDAAENARQSADRQPSSAEGRSSRIPSIVNPPAQGNVQSWRASFKICSLQRHNAGFRSSEMEVAQDVAAKRAEENSRPLRSTELPVCQERAAWLFLCGVLVGIGLYILANYMRALAWALVLAIAIWPL